MRKIVKQIHFRHLDGTMKYIPGVKRSDDLAPKMNQVGIKVNGKEALVHKRDDNHIVKITLHDESSNIVLSAEEKKLPERVQERILDRKASESDFASQANVMIRHALQSYADRGKIEILEWDKEVEVGSPESKGSLVTALSDIALADFADRGIEIPAHLKIKTAKVTEVKSESKPRFESKNVAS